MSGLLIKANRVVLLFSVLIAALGIALTILLSGDVMAESNKALLWAMALLPIVSLSAVRSGALRGLHHVFLGQLPECLIMPAGFVLALAVAFQLAPIEYLTADVAVALRLVASCIAFVIGAWLLKRREPVGMRATAPLYDSSAWVRASGPLVLLGGMGILNTQTDVLMIAAFRGSEAAGIFSAAARGAELVAFSLMVINLAIQPTISRLYTNGDLRRLQWVATGTARATLVIAVPAAFCLAVFGEHLLAVAFGARFASGHFCLVILCVAQVINAASGSVGHLLIMTGHGRESAVGMGIGAAANVLLNGLLVPAWGIEGAALATGLSLVIWNLILVVMVRKRLGLDPTVLGRNLTQAA